MLEKIIHCESNSLPLNEKEAKLEKAVMEIIKNCTQDIDKMRWDVPHDYVINKKTINFYSISMENYIGDAIKIADVFIDHCGVHFTYYFIDAEKYEENGNLSSHFEIIKNSNYDKIILKNYINHHLDIMFSTTFQKEMQKAVDDDIINAILRYANNVKNP